MSSSRKLRIPKHPKERGEWVELVFMAHAARLGLKVAKPYGDCTAYDLILENRGRLIRIQVKSTMYRCRGTYACGCERRLSRGRHRPYTPQDFDYLAAYVIPQDAWYIVPSRLLPASMFRLDPCNTNPRNHYHPYREAWRLLAAPASTRSQTKVARRTPRLKANR